MTGIVREIRSLRRSLRTVDAGLGRLARVLSVDIAKGVPAEARPRRFSAKARASLVLQGRYMGYVRQLKPRQKAQVRKIREAKGVRAAITRAKRLSQS